MVLNRVFEFREESMTSEHENNAEVANQPSNDAQVSMDGQNYGSLTLPINDETLRDLQSISSSFDQAVSSLEASEFIAPEQSWVLPLLPLPQNALTVLKYSADTGNLA